MADNSTLSLYDQVVKVTQVYLGPAAERFIARQIENHTHKIPQDLTKKDLLKLIDWMRLSISLLTEDAEIVDEYVAELYKLTGRANKR